MKKAPHYGGAGKEYLNAVRGLYSNQFRRLPPYARVLVSRLAARDTWQPYQYVGTSLDGCCPQLWVFFGPDAWNIAKERIGHYLLVVAPYGEDPAMFDWRILAGNDPIIIQPFGSMSGDSLQALVSALVRDGVKRALYLGDKGMIRYAVPGRLAS